MIPARSAMSIRGGCHLKLQLSCSWHAATAPGVQGNIGELQGRLDEVSRRFRRIHNDAACIEGDVSDLIQARMQSLKVCRRPARARLRAAWRLLLGPLAAPA